MITDAILKLINHQNLKFNEVRGVVDQITNGTATDAQMGAFLVALRMKGETVEEITAAAEAIKNKCIPFNLPNPAETIDMVGTGGDCCGTFNITTVAAFIVAAAGVKVTKHGNRSSSSKSGAADVLETFGVDIYLSPKKSLKVLEKTGICFLFAQNHNPCMGHIGSIRKQIATRTVFNILGPLINPARAGMQLIGTYDEKLTEPMAKVLKNLGITDGMVVHGTDGLDEASITSDTIISQIRNSEIKTYIIRPEDFGLKRAVLSDISGGSPEENKQIILNILSGKDKGARLDITSLNAALALYIAKKVPSIKEGVELAKATVDKGLALKVFSEFVKLSSK